MSKFNMSLNYMTEAEASFFKLARESGRLSFFRISLCIRCEGETAKGKLYCSKRCAMQPWDVKPAVDRIVNTDVTLETKAGSIRQGRLTQVTWDETKISGHLVLSPKGVVLNGDVNDEIEWRQINWINSDAL